MKKYTFLNFVVYSLILVMFASCGNVITDEQEISIRIPEVNVITDSLQEDDKMTELRMEYTSACKEYNSSVASYNDKAEDIRRIISELKKFNVVVNHEVGLKDFLNSDINDDELITIDIENLKKQQDEITEETVALTELYYDICQSGYEQTVSNYNILADGYNGIVSKTCIDYIYDVPRNAGIKTTDKYRINTTDFSEESFFEDLNIIYRDTNELAVNYKLVDQITAPNLKWIISRLDNVSSIEEYMSVTDANDPNKGLGRPNGGYKNCTYFTIRQIDPDTIKGSTIVDKGTDAGGCIESYGSLKSALKRCEYLSQYDNTILSSGSYVLVGTMVVRTSYKLSEQQQIDLTDEIIRSFTMVEASE